MKKNKPLSLADILKKQHPGWTLVTPPEQTSFLKVRDVFQIAHVDGGPVRVAEINNGIIVIIG
jgi:hypothetical protein